MDKLRTLCLAIGLALAVTSIASADATSTSKAVLDWTTFSCQYTGTSINWVSRGSVSNTGAEDRNSPRVLDQMLLEGWVDTSAKASVPNAWGAAWTTDWEVGEEVYADTAHQGVFSALSLAVAGRGGYFEAVGDGTLTASVDYSLEQVLTTEVIGDYAVGLAVAWLDLRNYNTRESDDDGDDIQGLAYYDAGPSFFDFFDSKSGTLTVSLAFSDGDTGEFVAAVENIAGVQSIPAPGAALLGIIGLGVAGVKLRKFA